MKKSVIFFIFQLFVFSYSFSQPINCPAWAKQGNIYEVNIRQYTKEGTLNAFAKHLTRLKKMGVKTLWFMPINPISTFDRKGSLGSYYAVSNYKTINPEYGTLTDWKKLVSNIHNIGMKVIIDWVPNHTGADNNWITSHPDFFVKDSFGKPAIAFDWADVKQLDYKNVEMQDSMIAAMKYWIKTSDIDGFRCDVAWNVPASFWKKCIPQLKKMKPIFMLAEGDSVYLAKSGFDAIYNWHTFKTMIAIAKGEKNATALDMVNKETQTLFPKNTLQLYFTSNHDENSWNNSDFGTFPGAKNAPFAVFTQTMYNAMPLIYSGQEEPVLRAIKFFDKDPIEFKKYERTKFYTTLLSLRNRNAALANNAAFEKINVGNNKALFAYQRFTNKQRVFVILNLSDTPQTATITNKKLLGTAVDVFKESKISITNTPFTIEPWGYRVYEY